MKKLSYLPSEKLNSFWTDQEISKLCTILDRKYALFLNDEHFEIESGANETQVQICVRLMKNDASVAYPLECVCVLDEEEKTPQEQIACMLLDYIDNYWDEYFQEDRQIFLPLDWHMHTIEDMTFYLRGFVRRLSLEKEADALLAKYGAGEYEIHPISSEI